jgi:hypothetical protein
MASTDLAHIERRVRVAYELGRLRLSLLGVVPVLLLVAFAVLVTDRPLSAVAFGALTVAAGAGMLFYGRDPQRAVLPGIAAGVVPLVLALCANQVHHCGADGCSTLCVPACIAGGIVSGLLVASVGHRRGAGTTFWLSASALALLTGAMGCTCIGYSGVVGLALGFGLGSVPGLMRKRA